MKTLIISSSPNKTGLTQRTRDKCIEELQKYNVELEHINLKDRTIVLCKACGEKGWGECYKKHFCGLKDDFNSIFKDMGDFDSFIFITPVYFHEMSEVSKTFFDRLKRCDVLNEKSEIKTKPVINIACAGGSGTGAKECLKSMRRVSDFLGLKNIKDIDITGDNFTLKGNDIVKSIKKMVA